MRALQQKLLRGLPLLIFFIGFAAFFYFDLHQYLSFAMLKAHREMLVDFAGSHAIAVVLMFILVYIVVVTFAIPGPVILTLTGGFLFGAVLGTVFVVIGATIGATLIFLIMRTSLGAYLEAGAKPWLMRMERGFQENAVSYLLFLRLVPLFPFGVINIVAGILNVPLRVFFLTTLFGIIPGSFVYAWLGSGLGYIFDQDITPDLGIIFHARVFFPMLALGLLSLVPIMYKKLKKRQA